MAATICAAPNVGHISVGSAPARLMGRFVGERELGRVQSLMQKKRVQGCVIDG